MLFFIAVVITGFVIITSTNILFCLFKVGNLVYNRKSFSISWIFTIDIW